MSTANPTKYIFDLVQECFILSLDNTQKLEGIRFTHFDIDNIEVTFCNTQPSTPADPSPSAIVVTDSLAVTLGISGSVQDASPYTLFAGAPVSNAYPFTILMSDSKFAAMLGTNSSIPAVLAFRIVTADGSKEYETGITIRESLIDGTSITGSVTDTLLSTMKALFVLKDPGGVANQFMYSTNHKFDLVISDDGQVQGVQVA